MYNLIESMLHPFMVLSMLCLLGLVNLWRRRADSRRRLMLVCLPYAVLMIWSLPAVATMLIGSLEWRDPPLHQRPDDAQAIVILGGWMAPSDELRPEPELGTDSLLRCMYGVQLYRQGPPIPVLLTGSLTEPVPTDPSLARVMGDFVIKFGVAESDVIIEGKSTSTYENAVESARLLKDRGLQRIVLVTDAAHMPRAKRCFQKQGLTVTPAPCRFNDAGVEMSVYSFLPNEDGPRGSQTALHEYIGLLWYWVKGRI